MRLLSSRCVRLLLGAALVAGPFGAAADVLLTTNAGASAASVTLYVSPTGAVTTGCTSTATPCRTIQEAVTAGETASYAGDAVTVHVAAGTYRVTTPITITAATLSSLTVEGPGAPATTITGGTSTGDFVVTGGTVTIEELSIEQGHATTGGGVDVTGGAVATLSDDDISYDTAVGGGGGVTNDLSTVTLIGDTLSHDSATWGGGLNAFGTTVAEDDTFTADTASTSGGGVLNTGLLLLDGDTFSDDSASAGGALYNVDGGTAVLTRDTFSNDSATTGGGIADESGGEISVAGSVLSGDRATGGGGALFADQAAGTVNLSKDTFSDDSATTGGAVLVADGTTAHATGDTYSQDTATRGGALWSFDSDVTVTGSTFDRDQANNVGGAIGSTHDTHATAVNSTFTKDTAELGGAYFGGTTSRGTFIFDTFATDEGVEDGGAIYLTESSTTALVSSSIFFGATCSGTGTITDGGDNVQTGRSCPFTSPSSVSTSSAVNLYPLRSNTSTGPKTRAIGPTSAAYHLVSHTACEVLGVATDERGDPRPGTPGADATRCDAGAYEFQAGATPTSSTLRTVTLYVREGAIGSTCTASTPVKACGSLATAVTLADSGAGAITITVGPGNYPGGLTLVAYALTPLTIRGAGASSTVITGGESERVMSITSSTSGSVIIEDLSIDNGYVENSCGAGAEITSSTAVSFVDVTFSSNVATTGCAGAVFETESIVTFTDVTFASNSAIAYGAVGSGDSTAHFTNVTFAGNISGDAVGAFDSFTGGSATFTDVTFATGTTPNAVAVEDTTSTTQITISQSILYDGTCTATINDGGYNVETGDSCGFTTSTSKNTATTINLHPLNGNGSTGPKTMAIGPTSGAYHLVPHTVCEESGVATDERGDPRPGTPGTGTTRCDAGAYEYQAGAPVVAIPTSTLYVRSGGTGTICTGATTADACGSIDAALTWAATGSGTMVITIGPGTYPGGIDVAPATLTSLTIKGASASSTIVTGDGAERDFLVSGGTVTIRGLSIDGGRTTGTEDGAGVTYAGGGTLLLLDDTISRDVTEHFGGGVYNTGGAVALVDDTLAYDSAEYGGAITSTHGATLTAINDTFYRDTAEYGGAVGAYTSGAARLADDTFYGDTSSEDQGGAIEVGGTTATVSASVFDASTCYIEGGSLTGTDDVATTSSCNFTGRTDWVVTGATVGVTTALKANGSTGPETLSLFPSSPAINLVPGTACMLFNLDERTDPRPGDVPGTAHTTSCDAGAYELQHTIGTLTQTTESKSGSTSLGTAATFQLGVTNTPATTGDVEFTQTSTPVTGVDVLFTGTVTVSDTLPIGHYVVSGTDSDLLDDQGAWTFSLTVTGYATTTALTLPGSETANQSVTWSVKVSSTGRGQPTSADASVYTATTLICTVTSLSVTGPTAVAGSCTGALGAGPHTHLHTTYAGGGTYAGSTSSPTQSLTVTGYATTTELTLPSTTTPNPAATWAVKVSSAGHGDPTPATVAVSTGATAICTVTTWSDTGTAAIAGSCTGPLGAGDHPDLEAAYPATGSFAGSSTGPKSLTISGYATTTTLTLPSTTTPNPAATWSVTVRSTGKGQPTSADVSVYTAATLICTVTTWNDTGTTAITGSCEGALRAGTHADLHATYAGAGTYGGSTSSPTQSLSVTGYETTTDLTLPGSEAANQPVTWSVRVSSAGHGDPAPATVVVSTGSTAICTVTTWSDTGTTAIAGSCTGALRAGTHANLHATYAGAGTYAGSTSSPTQSLSVTGYATTTALTLPSTTTPSPSASWTVKVSSTGRGQPASTTAVVSTGATLICTVTTWDGTGTTAMTGSCTGALRAGAHTHLHATYAGGGTYAGSTSSPTQSLTVSSPHRSAPTTPPVTAPTPPSAPRGSTTATSARSSTPNGKAVATLPSEDVTVEATGEGAFTLAAYAANPTAGAIQTGTAMYFDVDLASGSAFTSLTVTVCDAEAGSGLDWWNGTSWQPFSQETSATGCVIGTVTSSTSPTLEDLTGTPLALVTPTPPPPPPPPPAANQGYLLATHDGGIAAYGAARALGSESGQHLAAPVVGMAATPTGKGYWLVAADGGVFSFGTAAFEGSEGGQHLAAPIVGMAATPTGKGYWLVAADGGVFSFGTAAFEGSEGGQHLAAPIVGMAATPTGKGYWLVAADGGVFSFGTAAFEGSEGGQHLAAPIVGMAATPTGKGYWLVAADGGVFSFGTAGFEGSEGGEHLAAPIVGMVATSTQKGYWLVAADGGVFSFGTATFYGSDAGKATSPVVGAA